MSDDNDTSQTWEQITEPTTEVPEGQLDGEGTEETLGDVSGGLAEEHDGAGNSNSVGTSSGNVQRSLQSSGGIVGEEGTDGEGTVTDEPAVYEGVTSESFQTMYESFDSKLDALNASCLVLVFAMFLCAGAIAVDTLIRSFEWKK